MKPEYVTLIGIGLGVAAFVVVLIIAILVKGIQNIIKIMNNEDWN